jgi:phenylacetic acid degradation protein
MIYEFEGHVPEVDPSSFVHPQACVIGNVKIGKDVFVGPFATLRGDFGEIIIEDGCNVQENCTIHMFPGVTVKLAKDAHIGHGAIIHGAEIEENVMVGIQAVILDESKIGKNSIIGAMALVKTGMIVPERSLVVGNPGKVIREVSDEMVDWKTKGTQLYKTLPGRYAETMCEIEARAKAGSAGKKQISNYKTWSRTKKLGEPN